MSSVFLGNCQGLGKHRLCRCCCCCCHHFFPTQSALSKRRAANKLKVLFLVILFPKKKKSEEEDEEQSRKKEPEMRRECHEENRDWKSRPYWDIGDEQHYGSMKFNWIDRQYAAVERVVDKKKKRSFFVFHPLCFSFPCVCARAEFLWALPSSSALLFPLVLRQK